MPAYNTKISDGYIELIDNFPKEEVFLKQNYSFLSVGRNIPGTVIMRVYI